MIDNSFQLDPLSQRRYEHIQAAQLTKKQQLNQNWKKSIAAARQLEDQLQKIQNVSKFGLQRAQATEYVPDENDKFEEIVNHFNRKSMQGDDKQIIGSERELYSQQDVGSLLNHLTDKFTRLLSYIQQQDAQKTQIETELQQTRNALKQVQFSQQKEYGPIIYELKSELDNTYYEKEQLQKALTDVKKKVQERVPVINLVEERRIELETINQRQTSECKNLQEQLRDSLKQNSKLRNQLQQHWKDQQRQEQETESLKERLQSVRKLNQQQSRKLNEFKEAQTSPDKSNTNNIDEMMDMRVLQLKLENQELSKNLHDLIQMQDGPNSQETIFKEHIKVLEFRVKELVTQNLNLVTRLTQIEEKQVKQEINNENRHPNQTKKEIVQYQAMKQTYDLQMLMSPESTNSCEFKISSRNQSYNEVPWSAKNHSSQLFSDQKQADQLKTGKVTSGRQNIVVQARHVESVNNSSSLETLKAQAITKIDDRNNTFSDAAPFQIDSPSKLENVMEMDELKYPEDSMLLKESGNTAKYLDDMDDIESVLSLQPEMLELKNLN